MDVTDNVRYVNNYKLKCIDLPSFKTKFNKGSSMLSFKFDFQSDSTVHRTSWIISETFFKRTIARPSLYAHKKPYHPTLTQYTQ